MYSQEKIKVPSPIVALRKKSIRIEKAPPLTRDEINKKEVDN
jgi:hypothetical protein